MLGVILMAALDLLFMPVETTVVDIVSHVAEVVDMTSEVLAWLVDLLVTIWNCILWRLARVIDEIAPRTCLKVLAPTLTLVSEPAPRWSVSSMRSHG